MRLAKAAEKKKSPPSWKSLDAETKKQIESCITACLASKSKDQKRHPPLLVQEFWPGHDPDVRESQLETWKEYAYYGAPSATNFPFSDVEPILYLKGWMPMTLWPLPAASSERPHPARIHAGNLALQEAQARYFPMEAGREYLFGLFRLDKTYNEPQAVEAFKAWFRECYGKAKGGGNRARWRARLNNLIVMRLWKRFPKRKDAIKRVEHVAALTTANFKGCKDYCEERRKAIQAKLGFVHEAVSKAANEEMSGAPADALKFFESLFPGEKPLSY